VRSHRLGLHSCACEIFTFSRFYPWSASNPLTLHCALLQRGASDLTVHPPRSFGVGVSAKQHMFPLLFARRKRLFLPVVHLVVEEKGLAGMTELTLVIT
jgi:hypothetical protein